MAFVQPNKEFKMDISINAKVYCQDKMCGHTQAVILEPTSEVITHVVVRESKAPHTQRLVPVKMIDASLADSLHISCDLEEFENLPSFVDMEYIQANIPHYSQAYDYDMSYFRPVVVPEKKMVPLKHYHIPGHELAVDQGMPVFSADGFVIGKVDEFLVDQDGWHLTHLVLREGHLWGQRDIVIPAEVIDKVKESKLRLKLRKDKIEELPSIPVRPKWA